MDVRCEKCSTEYELDEARLKPGGVTVKCTNCGHMFKIRKRVSGGAELPSTMLGMPKPQPPAPAPAPAAPAAPVALAASAP
ncbi:MAG TPA: zinc-ribbon domain-containing protein, partial [Kofleriaceae bacterium]|nr:zinc-ribbon domain-containing protein [Kofleriaceae bacterium]